MPDRRSTGVIDDFENRPGLSSMGKRIESVARPTARVPASLWTPDAAPGNVGPLGEDAVYTLGAKLGFALHYKTIGKIVPRDGLVSVFFETSTSVLEGGMLPPEFSESFGPEAARRVDSEVINCQRATNIVSAIGDKPTPPKPVQKPVNNTGPWIVALSKGDSGAHTTTGILNGSIAVTWIVDTGATFTSIPLDIAERLGAKEIRRQKFEMADGRVTSVFWGRESPTYQPAA
jgi:Aspartyl protease